jgi:hypothetical protein
MGNMGPTLEGGGRVHTENDDIRGQLERGKRCYVPLGERQCGPAVQEYICAPG